MSAPSLRERKKQRTRLALAAAASRLFREQGYDQTTVAEIAAAAEVSTRTFFTYFPSKEDVLFAGQEGRLQAALAVLATPRPGEPVAELLPRAAEHMLASAAFEDDFASQLAADRARLIATTPALQAAALRRVAQAQVAIAEALRRTYPHLTETTAAAVVGAFLGSTLAAALASMQRGDTVAQLRAELRRATAIAVHGIATPCSG